MRFLVASFVIALLSGCASLNKPEREIRVTEYGADGSYMAQATGQVAGCRAVQTSDVKGCMKFKGTTCSFISADCATPK